MSQLDLGKVVGDTGPQGPKGDQGIQGPAGQTGPGVAVGGSANQVLVKHSGTNYDTQWVDAGNLPSIAGVQDAIAIVANGDTHPAIASGQFVYVRNHSTLAEGLYKATAAIGTDVALTTSNLTADGSGGLNDLKGQIDSLNSKSAYNSTEVFDTSEQGTINATYSFATKVGNVVRMQLYVTALSAGSLVTVASLKHGFIPYNKSLLVYAYDEDEKSIFEATINVNNRAISIYSAQTNHKYLIYTTYIS